MLIYNVTTSVDNRIHDSWLEWMMDEHVPEILGTGCFERHQLVRLLDMDETEAITYAVQLYATSADQYNQYQKLYANNLRKKSMERWGDRIISFRTLMQVVER